MENSALHARARAEEQFSVMLHEFTTPNPVNRCYSQERERERRTQMIYATAAVVVFWAREFVANTKISNPTLKINRDFVILQILWKIQIFCSHSTGWHFKSACTLGLSVFLCLVTVIFQYLQKIKRFILSGHFFSLARLTYSSKFRINCHCALLSSCLLFIFTKTDSFFLCSSPSELFFMWIQFLRCWLFKSA